MASAPKFDIEALLAPIPGAKPTGASLAYEAVYDQIKEAKAFSKDKTLPEDLIKALERIEIKYLPREVRFFYPFEIQVVDRQSAIENEKGKSAHSEYKKSQIQTAMTRVMGSLANGPGGVNPV